MDFLKKLFEPSKTWDQYKLIKMMRQWQDTGDFPLWSGLPESFILSSDFWQKALEIYRYTEQDQKEHAISLWSIYNQIIITDVTRGDENAVTTNDRVEVRFELIKGKTSYLRRLLINGKEKEKTIIPYEKLPKTQKDAEMRYLFNVHTHPPHKVSNLLESKMFYSYFSATDLNSLLSGKAVATGMISDKVTFLFKTRSTPKELGLPAGQHPDAAYIRDVLKIAEYEADFHEKRFRRVGEANT